MSWWLENTPEGIAWAATTGQLPSEPVKSGWYCPCCYRINAPTLDACPCGGEKP